MKSITDILELRKIQMDILSFVDEFCRKNGIMYSIAGGTLLGAIRHGGYIPWDDDIDIMLRREDYERLITCFLKEDTGHYVIYKVDLAKGYYQPYIKVADKRTVLQEPGKRGDFGVNIDVFPIDHLPDNPNVRRNIYKRASSIIDMLAIKEMEWRKGRDLSKNLLLMFGKFFLAPVSRKYLAIKLDKIAKGAGDESCKLRGDIVWGYGEKEIMDAIIFNEYTDLPFEDRRYMAIAKYDEYLTHLYGDYMQLPPVEKRVSHHDFTAWWK